MSDSIAADKACSNGPCREYLRRRGIRHTIPEKVGRQAARLRIRRGVAQEAQHRRASHWIKQHRAVATRYDKRRYVYLGTVTTAALAIWLRT